MPEGQAAREGTRVLQIMLGPLRTPNVIADRALVSVCEKGTLPVNALALLTGCGPAADAQPHHLQRPDQRMSGGRQPERASVFVEMMLRLLRTLNVIAYSALVSACEKGRLPGDALALPGMGQGRLAGEGVRTP